MSRLTEAAIRKAIQIAARTEKQIMLSDGEGRGTGRLTLVLRPMPRRITAEWMAQQWRAGKRTKSKIGDYPAISLAEARDIFERDFARLIQQGASIKVAGDSRVGTVGDLFVGYIQHLKEAGKPSWAETEAGLNRVLDTLGRTRPARDISPAEILGVLRPIYERGTRSMADHVRSYIVLRTLGALSRSMITDTRRRGDFSSFTIPQRAYQLSPRRLVLVGSTRKSLFGCTGGSNFPMPLYTRHTLAPFEY